MWPKTLILVLSIKVLPLSSPLKFVTELPSPDGKKLALYRPQTDCMWWTIQTVNEKNEFTTNKTSLKQLPIVGIQMDLKFGCLPLGSETDGGFISTKASLASKETQSQSWPKESALYDRAQYVSWQIGIVVFKGPRKRIAGCKKVRGSSSSEADWYGFQRLVREANRKLGMHLITEMHTSPKDSE